jgi:hypothetical protein
MSTRLRRWETYAASVVGFAIVAAALLLRPSSPSPAAGTQSASAFESVSLSPSPSVSASVGLTPSPSVEASASPTAALQPTLAPTPKPTVRPTAAPTPAPTITCYAQTNSPIEGPHNLMPGEQQLVDIMGFPMGQKVIMSAHYPDGSTVSIGTKYASAPDSTGWTHAIFTWTIPISMTPGVAQAIWHIPCGPYDPGGSHDFTIIPLPTPTPTPVVSAPVPSF